MIMYSDITACYNVLSWHSLSLICNSIFIIFSKIFFLSDVTVYYSITYYHHIVFPFLYCIQFHAHIYKSVFIFFRIFFCFFSRVAAYYSTHIPIIIITFFFVVCMFCFMYVGYCKIISPSSSSTVFHHHLLFFSTVVFECSVFEPFIWTT